MVAHLPSAGGISRFLMALVEHLRECAPEIELTLFIDAQTDERDKFGERLAPLGVQVVRMNGEAGSTPLSTGDQAVRRGPLWRLVRSIVTRNKSLYLFALSVLKYWRGNVLGQGRPWYEFAFEKQTIEALNEFDVVYFANPFFMKPIRLRPAVAATIHDLNFKHFARNYTPDMLDLVERQTSFWTERIDVIISSTRFIQNEIAHYYPSTSGRTRVVYLAPYSYSPPSCEDALSATRRLGIPDDFVFYPAGSAEHKNIGALIEAAAVLKRRGKGIPVVVTGLRVPLIGSDINLSERDAMWPAQQAFRESGLKAGEDVFLLGYVSNEDVDSLTRAAQVIVSTSIYEAGCGPAMDAWAFGVPVAFSNIPPFMEQLEVQGTEAWVFDPNDPGSIADVINEAISNKTESQRKVEDSRAHFGSYTWSDVAQGYAAAFHEAAEVAGKRSGTDSTRRAHSTSEGDAR